MSDEALLIIASAFLLLLGIAAVIHVVIPSPSRIFHRELSCGRRPISSFQHDHQFSISFDLSGFTVAELRTRSPEFVQMAWSEIVQITAFKRDLFTGDCICLFVARTDGTGIEVDEDMDGWKALCTNLPHYLQGCASVDDWLWGVATPAFAPNETVIYSREAMEGANADKRNSPG